MGMRKGFAWWHQATWEQRAGWILLTILALAYTTLLWRTKWIADDGYIYLTYVRTLWDHGELTFNLGEPVDAATGFLWLLLLVVFDAVLFFFDPRQSAFALSWACCFLSFALLAREVIRGERRFLLAIAAIFFTPFVISFSSSGLETPLILLLCVWFYTSLKDRWLSPTSAVLAGLMPFVRPELALALVVILVAAARERNWRAVRLALVPVLVLSALRWWIFGDVLPNTAFVKLFSTTYGFGRYYLYEFFASYWHAVVIFAVLALGTLWAIGHGLLHRRWPRAIRPVHVAATVTAVLIAVYVWRGGGDFMHGRFMLPSFVLATLVVVDVGLGWLDRERSPKTLAVLGAASVVLGLAIVGGSSYTVRKHENWYRGITDEQVTWSKDNPTINAWGEPNRHDWANWARAADALAQRVELPVGFAVKGIGQLGYYRDAARVFIFDRLSLTVMAGAMVDNRGYFRRPGHNAEVPMPVQYLEPRLTLGETPDAALNDLLSFRYAGRGWTLIALDQIPRYVDKGLLPADTMAKVDRRIGEALGGDWIDRNLVFYLRHRYPRSGARWPRIAELYDQLGADPEPSWISWYRDNREILEAAASMQQGSRAALPFRYLEILRRGTPKPIRSTFQLNSWKVRNRATCRLDVTQIKPKAPKGVRAKWMTTDEGPALALSSSAAKDAFVELKVGRAIEAQCGDRFSSQQPLAETLVEWNVTRAAGEPPMYFYLRPYRGKFRPYGPSTEIRIPQSEVKERGPIKVAFRVAPGQSYAMTLAVLAVAGAAPAPASSD